MTFSDRQRVVAAIVLAAAVVIALPVTASHGLVVVDEHTTDTDFSGASLTNASIEGTGTSASVVMTRYSGDYDALNDSGAGSAPNSFKFIGDISTGGTHTSQWRLEPTEDIDQLDSIDVFIGQTEGSDYGFTVDVYLVEGEEPDGTAGEGTKIADNWDPDFTTGKQTIQLDTNVDLDASKTYTLEFVTNGGDDGDTTSDRLFLEMDDGSNTSGTWHRVDGSADGDQVGHIILHSKGSPQTATYVGANYTADDIEACRAGVVLDNASATITCQGWDGSSWNDVGSSTVSSSGTHQVSTTTTTHSKWRVKVEFSRSDTVFSAELEDEAILFTSSEPTVDNSSASPNSTTISSKTVTFEIDVNDSDFATSQGDSVDVEFHTNTSGVVGTDTLTSNGTASVTADLTTGGDVKWWVEVSDSYGETARSSNFTVTVPSQITVVEERTLDIVNESGDASVKFFFEESDMVVERDINNGNISLGGLPVGEPFVVRVSLDGYYTRRVYLEDIFTQSRVFVLNKSANASDVVFKLNDKTGNFPTGSTVLFIDKPITDDFDDDGTNETQYVTIAGDFFGASGEFPITLHTDARYRIRIKNSEGEVRTLGAYEATADDVATLDVGEVSFPAAGADGYVLDASLNDDGTAITVKWQDIANNSSDLHITIFERGNESNELFDEVVNGSVQEYSRTISLTSDQQDTQWIVHWRITRDGNRLNIKLPVGGLPVTMPLDAKWIGSAALVFGTFVALLHGGELSTWGAIVMMAFMGVLMMFQWVDIAVEFYLAGGLIAVLGHLRARGGAV